MEPGSLALQHAVGRPPLGHIRLEHMKAHRATVERVELLAETEKAMRGVESNGGLLLDLAGHRLLGRLTLLERTAEETPAVRVVDVGAVVAELQSDRVADAQDAQADALFRRAVR